MSFYKLALQGNMLINTKHVLLSLFLVMILGVLIAKKRYPLAKYLFVLMIVTGVAIFLYKDVSETT